MRASNTTCNALLALAAVIWSQTAAANLYSLQLKDIRSMTQSIWIDNATHPTIALVYQVGCRWCKKQAQDLAKLSQSHSVNTVLIGMGASSRDLKTELRHFPSHLSAKEANRELLTQIKGVEAVPTTLYISPQGELIYKHRGYIPSATYLQVGRDYIVSKGAVGAPQ